MTIPKKRSINDVDTSTASQKKTLIKKIRFNTGDDLHILETSEDESQALQASASRQTYTKSTPPSSQPAPGPQHSSAEDTTSVTALFTSSSKYITAIRNYQWKEVRKSFHLINKKSNLLVIFALGLVRTNYLREQGNYGQYTLKIALNDDCSSSLRKIFDACPEKGQMSPLSGNDFRIGLKYEKAFDSDTIASHKGSQVPFPNISDARQLNKDTPLDSLPSLPASDLGEGSIVVVAFTLSSYTFGTGGISAKLEHVYVVDPGVKEQPLFETPVKPKVISLVDSSDEDDELV